MAQWIHQWQPIYIFHNALQNYIDIDCFIVPIKESSWMALHRARRTTDLADLAYWVSTPEQRWDNNSKGLAKVAKTKKSTMTRLEGFCDLFVPVVIDGKAVAAVVAGPFLDHELSLSEFRQIWLSTGGSHDAAFSNDFSYFCRVLLDTPVLEGPALHAFRSFTELFAQSLSGERPAAELTAKMEGIFYANICRSFYHLTWTDRIVRQHRYFQASWRSGRVTEWEQRELGIQSVPQRVIACVPAVETLRSPLDIQIQANRFQRAALHFAATRDDVAVGRHADHAVLLLHAPSPPGASEDGDAALLAREFQDFIRKKTGLVVFAGIGPRETKEHLYRSYVGALQALHKGVDQRKGLTHLDSADIPLPSQEALTLSQQALIKATLSGHRGKIELARGNFVATAHRLSGERLDALRVYFQRFGQSLVEEAARQERIGGLVGAEVALRWFAGLEKASNASEMVHALRAELDKTREMLEQPTTGIKNLRFSRARKWVEENFLKDPSLSQAAKEHGFSASSFARELKRSTGLSYSQWVGGLRLKHVQELLENTRLSASAIAASAGFDSLSYFFQWFKKQTGASPGAWRQGRRKGG